MKLKISQSEKLAYRMIMPYVVFIVLLMIFLLFSNIIYSFQDKAGTMTLENYKRIFSEPLFYKSLSNTTIWVVFSVMGQIVFGLILALLLSKIGRGQAFFRSIILILPWATLDIVAGVMWKWMYNDMYGVINDVLIKTGIINGYISWLAIPNLARVAVIIANIWKGFALSAMFFLAGLQGIPKSLYEACEIDGGGIFRKFFVITLSQLKPILVTTTMLTVIWTINYFPLIYTMTGGGPNSATETVVTYLYRLNFKFLEYNEGAALANILFVLILVIATFFLKAINKEEAAA